MSSIILGGDHLDSRGRIVFFNTLSFEEIKRFYCLHLNKANELRAWQGHQFEKKWYVVLKGKLRLNVLEFNKWGSDDYHFNGYYLEENDPKVIFIPEGSFTGFMPLVDDTMLIIFSNKLLEESLNDDYRYDKDKWTFR